MTVIASKSPPTAREIKRLQKAKEREKKLWQVVRKDSDYSPWMRCYECGSSGKRSFRLEERDEARKGIIPATGEIWDFIIRVVVVVCKHCGTEVAHVQWRTVKKTKREKQVTDEPVR